MASKKTAQPRFTPTQLQANLEFLIVWMMATSNPFPQGGGNGGGFFLRRAQKDRSIQHWDLHDPVDKSDPPVAYDHTGFFKALTWDIDPNNPNDLCIEKFLNGYLGDPNFSRDFTGVSDDFIGASQAVLPPVTVSRKLRPRYDDHTCPPLSEIQQLISDIATATAAVKRSAKARARKKR
jgi:hypothetical protein